MALYGDKDGGLNLDASRLGRVTRETPAHEVASHRTSHGRLWTSAFRKSFERRRQLSSAAKASVVHFLTSSSESRIQGDRRLLSADGQGCAPEDRRHTRTLRSGGQTRSALALAAVLAAR